MINASHPGTTPHDTETASDLDSTIGDWTAALAKLLGAAFREVDTDREYAEVSAAKVSLLLRVQIERSSFDPTHNRDHLEQDMDGQAEETLRASEERWRTVFEHASVGIALTKYSRSLGMAKGFTLYMSRGP